VGVRSTVGVGSVFHLELDCVVRRRREGDPEPTAVPPQSAPADPLRLLVIEDDADCRERLVQGLALAGFAVDAAVDAPDAVERAGATPYDGITLDLKPGDRPGLQALHDIRVQGESRAAAVIGMSMPTVSGETAAFAIADILGKPSRAQDVRDVIARLGLPREPRARAMVVDDDPVARQLMAGTLEQLEIDVVTFPDGRQALDGLDAHRPDVLVLDLMMPDFDGFAVLDAIGRRPGLQQLRVIIWTSLMLTDDEYARLARSALAIVGKGGGAIETLLARLAGWRGGAALALDGGDR